MWENYRTYFQCTGKSVLMCQHQVNSTSLLFIKLPVPLHIIYVSSVMFLQGVLLKEKRNRYLAKKRWFWLQKSTCTYSQRKNRHALPKKQITRPIFLKPAVRRYNIYIVLYWFPSPNTYANQPDQKTPLCFSPWLALYMRDPSHSI